ncbi:MAG: hypothetical protein ABIM46_08190, partial [candidate division WOR-3 bacterium]
MMNAILFFALGWPDGIPSLDEIRAMDEKLRLRERFGIMELDTLPPDLPWDILKYSINLTIDTVGDSIMNARCDVEFQITEDSAFLRLNFVDSMSATPNLGLVVDSVLLDGAPAIWSLSGSDTGRILNIVIPNPSPGRIDTASVFYHGPPTHP